MKLKDTLVEPGVYDFRKGKEFVRKKDIRKFTREEFKKWDEEERYNSPQGQDDEPT